MIPIKDCLQRNINILGADYSNVGKTMGSGLFGRRKLLLSYDKNEGWKILRLNLFQIFFRKILDVYKTTHLNYIIKHWSKTTKDVNIENYREKTLRVWVKKYLVGLGNANASSADVTCFGEKHLDKPYRVYAAHFINANYREGDIVLVEGVKAGEIVSPKEHQQTRNITIDCLVQGWEPENFKELGALAFREATAKYEALEAAIDHLKENLPLEGELSEENMALLEKEIEPLIETISSANKFYKSKDPIVLSANKIIHKLFEQLKTGTHPREKPWSGFLLHCFADLRQIRKKSG